MGRFKKEVKAFGREFGRQGSILLFGKAPRRRSYSRPYRSNNRGAQRQYNKALQWARKNGFKK